MSTIASPRPSAPLQSPTSSRSSLSLDRQGPPSSQRRNKLALRDYYGIKAGAAIESTTSIPNEDHLPPSKIDKPDFDASAYVSDVLAKEGLEGVLKVEAGLVSEVRGLDGERKALIYDNYSKLITATDTIRHMRTNMDPLTPMTTMLEPAVAHIAQTASDLGNSLRPKNGVAQGSSKTSIVASSSSTETVRWVLNTSKRLRSLKQAGREEEAMADWAEIKVLLDQWKDVRGVDEIRAQAEAVMNDGHD